MDTKPTKLEDLTMEQRMWRSLNCLYYELPAEIVNDVKMHVKNAFNELKNKS